MTFSQYKKRLGNTLIFSISAISIVLFTMILTRTARATGSSELSLGVNAVISMSITGNSDETDCSAENFNSCSTFGNIPPNQYATTSSLISVYTNSSDGYSLSVKADNHADLQTESGSSIPAGTLTGETGGQGVWSYKTDATGVKTNWTAMTTTDTTIKGTSIYSASTSDTTVTYGVSTGNRQASGNYSTTLIYTATAPNDTEVFEPNPTANFTGDHVTFSTASVPVASGSTGTVTITPAEGYYLSSFTCTNGYTNNATTGSSATSAQTVTITNPNVAKSSTCTATLAETVVAYMQDIATICPTLNEGDDPVTLTDARDNQKYKVFKAKDGNCWMGENLRYGVNPDGTGHPFVASDAALSNSGLDVTKMLDLTYDSTNPNTAGRIKNGSSDMMTADNSVNAFSQDGDNYTEPYINIYQANDVANYDGQTKYGVLYNYCAVTGGTVCNTDDMLEDAPGSVCPKGWMLPGLTVTPTGTGATTDGSVKTYDNLANSYGYGNTQAGMNGMLSSPTNFLRAGIAAGGLLDNRSSAGRGYYWPSTKYPGGNGVYNLNLYDYSRYYVNRGNSRRSSGFSARCVSE